MKLPHRFFIAAGFLFLIALACELPAAVGPQQVSSATPRAVVTLQLETSQPPAPTSTPPIQETPSPQPSATVTIVRPTAQARINVATVNLRVGPGTTFAVVERLKENGQVNILGKAAGDEWVLADTGTRQGWLAVSFLEIDPAALEMLPVEEVKSTFVLKGYVLDAGDASPINGIGLAVTQKNGADVQRTDAQTAADGSFFAYLPDRAAGTWTVEVVGIDCKSSIMNSDCKYTGTFVPQAMSVSLPVMVPLYFRYLP